MSFDTVWDRLVKELGIKNQYDLADRIGVSQSAVSKYKNEKKVFPAEWAYKIYKKYGLFTEWVMTGQGPKSQDECHEKQEELLTGYIAEWIRQQNRKNPNFSANFQTDCALAFPEFANWLKERKEGRG